MSVEKYILQDGSTLEITTTDKSFPYKEVTTKIIPAPVGSKYLTLPLSPSKIISGQSNVIIENLRFENATGAMINISNSSNITIRNCFFNKGAAEAISVYIGTNIRVENCLFYGVTTAFYASTSQNLKVINNQAVNMRQRSGPARGQFVQFNNVRSAGNEISGNKIENFYEDYNSSNPYLPGVSNPEDAISMFGGTSGTAASPILIRNNIIRGGGPSQSGGGIVAGDHSGSYITIDGNTLLNPGQYGIAIAGGSNNIITNNKIFSKQTPWSNNPLFIWMQAGSTVCANNTIKSNRATWTDKAGNLNGGWNAGNCTNTIWEKPTPITEAELNVPAHLIDFVSPEELLKIRGK